jgi:hypothetical protein
MTPLKVAIVGKSPHSLQFAPYDDPSWEIWWIGKDVDAIPRWDRLLEIHNLDDGLKRWPTEYVEWLATEHGKPVYVQNLDPRVPSGVVYPKDQVVAEYGTYFNNSVSWAFGLALHLGAKEIALYGIDMATNGPTSDGEYEHQRPSCEYLVGLARGLGVDVFIHPNSTLLKCQHLYGFDFAGTERARLICNRKAELRGRIATADDGIRQCLEAKHKLSGALEQLEIIEQWS